MPPREWRLYIEDILESISRIQRYTGGMVFNDFRVSDITVDAVVRNFIIIGEASRQVPVELEKRYPEIPWERMRGLRNVVVHQYFGMDLGIIWETALQDLPLLVPLLQKTLKESL